MTSQLDFTGERFVPGIPGEIAHEHWHRYAFARRFAAGRRVLDVACGEGYGSALLAAVAGEVTGVDIAQEAVAHATEAYRSVGHLRFVQGSAAALPLPDASVDMVVSFETIEHLPRADQPRMIAEIARVLAPDGVVVLSAPNPVEYSDARNYRNPFHTHEPTGEELRALLGAAFPVQRWFSQRRFFGSAIWSDAGGSDASSFEAWQGDGDSIARSRVPAAMYFVAIAARNDAALPKDVAALSLFSDTNDAELGRLDVQAAEVLRLDELLRSRDASLDRATHHIHHLERLASEREKLVQERDVQLREVHDALAANEARAQGEIKALQQQWKLALSERDGARSEREVTLTELAAARTSVDAFRDESDRLGRAVQAQERIIAYRQSARWWVTLPWLRLRLLFRKPSQ